MFTALRNLLGISSTEQPETKRRRQVATKKLRLEGLEQRSMMAADFDDQIAEVSGNGVTLPTNSEVYYSGTTLASGSDVKMYEIKVPSIPAGEQEWIEFDIDRTSGNLDSYIRLFDSAGNQVPGGYNDDGKGPGEASTRDSFLLYRFTKGGNYYLGVSSYGNDGYNAKTGEGDRTGATKGGFFLTINRRGHDLDDQLREAKDLGTITGQKVATGQIVNDTNPNTGNPTGVGANDVDMYKFVVSKSNQRLTFNLDGTFNSYLRIFDANGKQIAANDDGYNNLDSPYTKMSYIQHLFANPGTYYLGVSGTPNSAYSPETGLGDAKGTSYSDYKLIINMDMRLEVGTPMVNDQWAHYSDIYLKGTETSFFALRITKPVVFQINSDPSIRDGIQWNLIATIRIFDSTGKEIAKNNNNVKLQPGLYYVGVSVPGNDSYNPVTGLGFKKVNDQGLVSLAMSFKNP